MPGRRSRQTEMGFFDGLAIYSPLSNPLKRVDMDILAVSNTLAACKIFVPSAGDHLIPLG
jgi:hypothetical protein